jgi:hypothetical protein
MLGSTLPFLAFATHEPQGGGFDHQRKLATVSPQSGKPLQSEEFLIRPEEFRVISRDLS